MIKIISILFIAICFFLNIPALSFASSDGYIGLPTIHLGPIITWYPSSYTTSPFLDTYHFYPCSHKLNNLIGKLYNFDDNSVAMTTTNTYLDCDGYLSIGDLTSVNFIINNNYFILFSDPLSGQTWKTPCFKETDITNFLVECDGNKSPVIQNIPTVNIPVGSSYITSGSFTDTDSSSWTATVNYGDGTGDQQLEVTDRTFSLNHQYTDQGTFSIDIMISDNQGAVSGTSAQVMVIGAGTISIANNFYKESNILWSPNNYISNPQIDSDHYIPCSHHSKYLSGEMYNYSNNSVVLTSSNLYLDCDGFLLINNTNDSNFQLNYPYYVKFIDHESGQTWRSSCFTRSISDTIVSCEENNIPPEISSISATSSSILIGEIVDLTGNFNDINIFDNHSGVWDWGDGATSSATISESNGSGSTSGSHMYNAAGEYTVSLTITDQYSASDSSQYQYINVSNP